MKYPNAGVLIFIVCVGIISGFIFPSLASYFVPISAIFSRVLSMLVIPLAFASVVVAVSRFSSIKEFGKKGGKIVLYFLFTTLAAIFNGLFFVFIFKPGHYVENAISGASNMVSIPPSVTSVFTNMIPSNMLASLVKGQLLSTVIVAVIIGLALYSNKKAQNLINPILEVISNVMLKITSLIIPWIPLAVFVFLITSTSAINLDMVASVSVYVLVVFVGLFTHAGITLCLFLYMNGVSFIHAFKKMFTAIATGISTSSSQTTLPITESCLLDHKLASNRVTSIVIPLGTTINMNGTALYQIVATVFIAQAYSIDLTLTHYLLAIIMTLFASFASTGIPGAGLIMIALVLKVVGLPMEGIGLLLVVDRILDMFRTGVNIWANSVVAMIISKEEPHES